MKRYEQLAEEISTQIRQGILRQGDQLPSVRRASGSHGVSPSTVFSAYYLLESQGHIEARPRSGYYVAPNKKERRAEPPLPRPSSDLLEVDVSKLIFEVLGHVRQRETAPLGSAFPSPDLFPLERLSRSMGRAMRRLDPWQTVEDLAPGSEGLRRQLSLRYLAVGAGVDAGEIIVTNGAMEALNLALEVLTKPGDLIAVESPTFYGALQALERLGLRAVEVATHPRTGVDIASLQEVLDKHPVKACWFMTNFQNPLGCLMPEARKQDMVKLLAERGIPLIEDGVYDELYFGVRKPWPAKAYDKEGMVLHCSSFSKCLAPGYRIGWVAAGRYASDLSRRKLMTSLGAPVPSQEGLLDFLQHGGYDLHLRRLRDTLAQAQARALRLVAKHFPSGTKVTKPEGGYFLWLEMPGALDALALHRLALSHNISLAPGHLFSADHRHANCIRLNYGHPGGRTLDDAIKTVGQLACLLITDLVT